MFAECLPKLLANNTRTLRIASLSVPVSFLTLPTSRLQRALLCLAAGCLSLCCREPETGNSERPAKLSIGAAQSTKMTAAVAIAITTTNDTATITLLSPCALASTGAHILPSQIGILSQHIAIAISQFSHSSQFHGNIYTYIHTSVHFKVILPVTTTALVKNKCPLYCHKLFKLQYFVTSHCRHGAAK